MKEKQIQEANSKKEELINRNREKSLHFISRWDDFRARRECIFWKIYELRTEHKRKRDIITHLKQI